MSLTAMVAGEIAGQHGCEVDDPCRECIKTAELILHRVALQIHIIRFDNAPNDSWYSGIIKARSIVLDGRNL